MTYDKIMLKSLICFVFDYMQSINNLYIDCFAFMITACLLISQI